MRLQDPELTDLLHLANDGDLGALDAVFVAAYQRLHQIGCVYAQGLPSDSTLQATSIVHDAYLKLRAKKSATSWSDTKHFLCTAAAMMHSVVVDHARRAGAIKRGGDYRRVPLDEASVGESSHRPDVHVAEAIEKLRGADRETADVFMLRYYCGLTRAQSSKVLQCTPSRIDDLSAFARAFLIKELTDDARPD